MPELYVVRRQERKGLFIPMSGTKNKPSLMFFLPKMDKGQLDQMVRSELAKQGVTKEADVQAVIDKAEKEYDRRVKTAEVEAELRRLMDIKANGGKLIQVGYRKWKQAFFRPIGKK